MDDTELHYLYFDPDDVWDIMTEAYMDAGGDILYPGDEKEMLLRGVQAGMVQILASLDTSLRRQTLQYADGEYLDAIGDKRGCTRIAAQSATTTVEITTNATYAAETLEAGTTMTEDGQIFYELVNDLPISGLQETLTAEVICSSEGTAGNGLTKGAELVLSAPDANINRIVALADATGGTDEEEDDAYRERIREFGVASVTTGPKQQYEAAAKSASSEVLDANAVNGGAGVVDVYLIIESTSASEKKTVLGMVEKALSGTNVRPLNDQVVVSEATDIPYVLNLTYTSDGSSDTKEAIDDAITEYQDWQNKKIGRPFNPDRLVALIYQAGATRATIDSTSTFNGSSTIAYTEIEQGQRCTGTISVTQKSG